MEYDDKHCGITVKLLLFSYVPMTANYSLPQVVSAKGGRFCKNKFSKRLIVSQPIREGMSLIWRMFS